MLNILPSMRNPDIFYVSPVNYKHFAIETAQFGLLKNNDVSHKRISSRFFVFNSDDFLVHEDLLHFNDPSVRLCKFNFLRLFLIMSVVIIISIVISITIF